MFFSAAELVQNFHKGEREREMQWQGQPAPIPQKGEAAVWDRPWVLALRVDR